MFERSEKSGSSYNNSGGVKAKGVLGADLSLTRGYSEEAIIFYNFKKIRPGKKKTYVWVCGDTNLPEKAAKIGIYKTNQKK